MVWYGMVWYGMVWYGMVWYGMVWWYFVIDLDDIWKWIGFSQKVRAKGLLEKILLSRKITKNHSLWRESNMEIIKKRF